jgi:hypothetical protein
MLKYKNFLVILLVFMFGAALLTGCAGEEAGETVPDDESGLSDNHDKIDSEADVEYDSAAKTVTEVNIKE